VTVCWKVVNNSSTVFTLACKWFIFNSSVARFAISKPIKRNFYAVSSFYFDNSLTVSFAASVFLISIFLMALASCGISSNYFCSLLATIYVASILLSNLFVWTFCWSNFSLCSASIYTKWVVISLRAFRAAHSS